MTKNIVVATIKPWNIRKYRSWEPPKGFSKFLISKKGDLTYKKLAQLKPVYVFFPHWSWKIPKRIYENFECVVFHMTDLPFGRGGSPLQNLLVRGIYKTKISAIRVVGGLDAGPVYLKNPFDLSESSAQEILQGASGVIFEMTDEILLKKPMPKPQRGKVVTFKRRTPAESLIPVSLSLRKLYDFIRMLDAPGYPQAFMEYEDYRLDFKDAKLDNKQVLAQVTISKITKKRKVYKK